MEPKKKPPRDAVVRFRCTAPEKEEMDRAAAEYGEDFSSWARRMLLTMARKKAP